MQETDQEFENLLHHLLNLTGPPRRCSQGSRAGCRSCCPPASPRTCGRRWTGGSRGCTPQAVSPARCRTGCSAHGGRSMRGDYGSCRVGVPRALALSAQIRRRRDEVPAGQHAAPPLSAETWPKTGLNQRVINIPQQQHLLASSSHDHPLALGQATAYAALH